MYAGRKVEEAEVGGCSPDPLHPLYGRPDAARSRARPGAAEEAAAGPQEIPGMVPPLFDLPRLRLRAARCHRADEHCRRDRPTTDFGGHWPSCWHSNG